MTQWIGRGAARVAAFALILGACVVVVVTLAFRLTEAETTRGSVSGLSERKTSRDSVSGLTGKIVFTSYPKGSYDPEIFVMSADGSDRGSLVDYPSGSDPDWSPDGKKIAFSSGGVFVMNADGTGQTNLTNDPAANYAPEWSPDGTKIVFNRGNEHDIFVMNADGSDQTPLANRRRGLWPTWSPDGTRIAFASLGVNSDIFVMNADGSGRASLTNTPAADENDPDWNALSLPRCVVPRLVGQTLQAARTRIRRASCTVGRVRYQRSESRGSRVVRQKPGPGTRRRRGTQVNLVVRRALVTLPAEAPALSKDKLSFVRGHSIFLARSDGSRISIVLHGTENKFYFDPAWSPDGRRLAVTVGSLPFGTHEYDDVYVFQGSRRRVSVDSGGNKPGNSAWAPDGRHIVLVGYEFNDGGALYTALPGAGSRAVERNHDYDIVDNQPSWSPDGRAIAFSRVAPSLSGLYLIRPNGTRLRRLTTTSAFNPTWSPDGRRVVFDDGRAINVINAGGSGLRQLVTIGEDPAWSPDGRTIAFVRKGSVWLMDSSGAHVRVAVRNADQPTWKLGSRCEDCG